jgi:hypothetical protein
MNYSFFALPKKEMQSATAANEKTSKQKRGTDEDNIRSIPFLHVVLSTSRGGFIDSNVTLHSISKFLRLTKDEETFIFADLALIVGSISYSLIMIALTASGRCPTLSGPGSEWNHMYYNTNHYEREPPTGPLMYLVTSLPFLQLLLTDSCWAVIMTSYVIKFMGFAVSLCIAGNTSAIISYGGAKNGIH